MQSPDLGHVSGERRRITALFADVVGSTSLAEGQDPEDWTALMNRTFAVMAEAVERYDGTVSQFRGDEIVALFGAPRAHEDDPWRAVRAGLDMVAGVDQLSRQVDVPVRIRVGINTGLTVVGDIGGGTHTEYTAMGDAMNVAARMQAAAPPGSVLITADTLRLVGTDFDVRDAGALDVKGKADPVHSYEVVGTRGLSTRGRGVPGLRSPMVGREREIATLEPLLAAAEAGRGRVALILGEPGIGKSRLLREFGALARDEAGASWAVGTCLSHGLSLPYHLIASLVRSLVGASDSDNQQDAVGALESRARELLGDEHSAVGYLAELLGVGFGGTEPDAGRGKAYLDAVAALVSATAASHSPLVLVAEDIHWADPSSSKQLESLLPICHDASVLFILAGRPDRTVPGWGVVQTARGVLGDALTEITLEPLDEGASRMLVSNLLEIEALPDDLRSKVLDKAEGNPFFVEEVVRMLIERGVIERHADRWVATAGIDEIEVPDTVEALVAARVDRLPDAARRAARVASVIGRRFPVQLLDQLDADNGTDDGSIHPELGVLEAHGLVRLAGTRPQLEYAFRHALVHQVVYSSLLKRERRQLHLAVGELLESRQTAHGDELAPVLAHHFEEAGDSRAVGYWLAAGRWALARFAVREAYDFYAQAANLLEGDDPETRRARVESAIGRDRAGITFVPGGEVLEILQAVLPDAEALEDLELLARVHMGIARALHYMGELYETNEALRTSLDLALEYAEQVDDPALKALPAAMMGEVRMGHGDYAGALESWLEHVPNLERQGLLADASVYAGLVARVYAVRGEFDEAAAWLDRNEALAERSGDPNAKLDADLYRSWVEQERGNLNEAHDYVRRAIATAEELGNVACSLMGNLIAGDQQLRMGAPAAAIPYLERGGELVEYCQVGSDLLAIGQTMLASARVQSGSYAIEDLDAALKTAQSLHSPLSEGEIRRQRAAVRLALAEPDWEGALADLEAAAEIFEAMDARPFLARTLHDLALGLERAGRTEEAASHRLRAAELFEKMGIPD